MKYPNRVLHHILVILGFLVVIVVLFYNDKDNIQPIDADKPALEKKERISFLSSDSLEITADLYLSHPVTAPLIILFHQAGWSRGEYLETAPKLNSMGYNCMAVDQRSGEGINNIDNRTAKNAMAQNRANLYLDAYTDLEAALNFAHEHLAQGKIIVCGSSYSASLVLKLAADYPDKVDGVLAFSPGEYFSKSGKNDHFIAETAKKIVCPVFITSAKDEKLKWLTIFENISSANKHSFLPESKGNHGSRALWTRFEDSKNYWQAVSVFLNNYFPGN